MTNERIAFDIVRMRKILLMHSYMYYEIGTSVISDEVWGSVADRLVELQNNHQGISESCTLYEEFRDFDRSTGFDLWCRRPIVEEWCKVCCELLLRDHDIEDHPPTGYEGVPYSSLMIVRWEIENEILDMEGKPERRQQHENDRRKEELVLHVQA